MARILLLLAMMLALAPAAQAAARGPMTPARRPAAEAGAPVNIPAPPPVAAVQRADWLRKPTGADVARFYPPRARLMGISGGALIRCTVTEAGTLADCKVVLERPPGEGFGQAALRLTPLFRMRPQTVDGRPVRSTVTIPVRFNFVGVPDWIGWTLIGAIGIIVALSLALNDAVRGAAGARTAPVWRTYGGGLAFALKSWAAYPAPLLLVAGLAGMDGWSSSHRLTLWWLLSALAGLVVTGAAYRFAFRRLKPADPAFRLGPLGLQFGETEGRAFVTSLLVALGVLTVGLMAAAAFGFALFIAHTYLDIAPVFERLILAAGLILVAIGTFVVMLRCFLITTHVVFTKEADLAPAWRATRATLFTSLALGLLWYLTIVGAGFLIGWAAGALIPAANAPLRWAAAVAEAFAAAFGTPLMVGVQTGLYKRLFELTPQPPRPGRA